MSKINLDCVSWLNLLLPLTERVQFFCANVAWSLQESHMLLPAQYLDLLMRNSFQALKPIINSVTSWDNDLRLNGRSLRAQSSADVLQLEVQQRQKSISLVSTFLRSQRSLFLISSQLTALCLTFFFMFGFKTSLVSAIFENELEEKNMEPRLTPSHNLEEESLFGTWTTFRRWSGILSKSLQERESHAPLRIHSGYSLAFFFFFFVIPRSSTWEQHVEFKGADMSQFGSLKACWLSCALHLLHSMHSNISVGQLGVITAHGARKADLGYGTNLYMWDHRRVTELDEKMAKAVVWLGKIS